ncbi:MAG: hypothetical protein JNK00_12800 [Flavipsychrobacter sp.]|nr:hypothetical protein [Flavipsychrobacter sp.]
MKNNMMKYALIAAIATVFFIACKKDEVITPTPVEQELITTLRLTVTNNEGFNKTFIYKVENGFGSTTQGIVTKDDIVLASDKQYDVEVQLLNEKKTPSEDITEEVKAESNDHLFLFQSVPAAGSGSITFNEGNKDGNGNAFNQKIKFKAGGAGTGAVTITLKHEPTDKAAATPDAAGGETDVEAVFNVKLQ